MTIIDAIKEVMRARGAPMTAKEAYAEIVAKGLYEFHAQNPQHVVLKQIRRHCDGIDFPTAAPTKHFVLIGENKFAPLDTPRRVPRGRRVSAARGRAPSLELALRMLQALHAQYVSNLKRRVIAELRRLRPEAFEIFAKELLSVYGFEDVRVRKTYKDGGIDGHGKLRVGLAHLKVAFQCKRWTQGNIQRTEIDKFRGAAQGDYELGIFFATTSFSKGAIAGTTKNGAIPIVLLDVNSIVDLMIEKRFGIEAETLVIPTYALDMALTSEPRTMSAIKEPSPDAAAGGWAKVARVA